MNNLIEFLNDIADKYSDLEAYSWLENGSKVSRTYSDLKNDADRTAAAILARFGTGNRIAIIGSLFYSWICTFFGIINTGNTVIPMDAKLSGPDLAQRLSFAGASAVFIEEKQMYKADALKAVESLKNILRLDDYPAAADCGSCYDSTPDENALACLMFTSGTTGDGFKAAMHTQRSIMAAIMAHLPIGVCGDRVLSVLPVHHCFELYVGQMIYLKLGCTICINDRIENILNNLALFKINTFVCVPAVAGLISSTISAMTAEGKNSNEIKARFGGGLYRIVIGGAAPNSEVLKTLYSAGISLVDGYGLTETAGGCFVNFDVMNHLKSAGKPYIDGMEVKTDASGEICLRGDMIMSGYYHNPALTEKVIDRDGWFHTGDIGEYSDEGYLYIFGRKDNMIKAPDGEKIYPEEIEDLIIKIPGVAMTMVCLHNTQLTALIYLKEDTEEKRASVRTAIDRINLTLPNYSKITDTVFFDRPFPVTTTQKIKRKDVLASLSGRKKKDTVEVQNEEQRVIMDKVRSVLPDTDIGIDDNLFECGLDSIRAAHLAVLLGCSPQVIYENRTVRALSMVPSLRNEETTAAGISKVKDINDCIAVHPECRKKENGCVLLTGGSGYLGVHLLKELLNNGKKVICLIRNKKAFDRNLNYFFPELADSSGYETLSGDITSDMFGMPETEYLNLAQRVDTVYHSAALVSHVGDVSTSYRINVDGTVEVINFCRKANAGLVFISSYAVSGFMTDNVFDEDHLDIGQDITRNPYIQTKYQAEEKVLLARKDGVPSVTFRLGNLSERVSDGKFQLNADSSGMKAQIRAFNALGVYPETMKNMLYDFTAVDETAKAIVLLAENRGYGNIWHIMNRNVIPLPMVAGKNIKCVSDSRFVEILNKNSDNRDAALLSVYFNMMKSGFNTNFSMKKTLKELRKLGFVWSQPEMLKNPFLTRIKILLNMIARH